MPRSEHLGNISPQKRVGKIAWKACLSDEETRRANPVVSKLRKRIQRLERPLARGRVVMPLGIRGSRHVGRRPPHPTGRRDHPSRRPASCRPLGVRKHRPPRPGLSAAPARRDKLHQGDAGVDTRVRPQRGLKARDVLVPDLHVDPIKVKARVFGCAVLHADSA